MKNAIEKELNLIIRLLTKDICCILHRDKLKRLQEFPKPSVKQCQTDDKENWVPFAIKFNPAVLSYKGAIKGNYSFAVNSEMLSLGDP